MLKNLFSIHKKNDYLKYLTIYITAYERRNNLERLFKSLKNLNVEIILLDSSPSEWEDKEKFKWIKYEHTPNALIYKVLFDAAKNCKTPYLIWSCDDDMINIKGLKNAVECIHKEKQYSSVSGRLKKKRSNYGKKEFYTWRKYYNYISSDPLERINNMFQSFCSPVHDVMRKECFIKSWEIVLNNPKLYPARYMDRIVGLTQAIYGNKRVINNTLLEREKSQRKKGKIFQRQIEWDTYPEILKKKTKPKEMLKVLQEDDPFSSLLVDLYGGDQIFYHQEIIKTLESYYSKIEKK